MKEENNKEEFEELAPKLKQLLKKEQAEAQLPNNYFQNFEARLQQRLETEQSLERAAPTSPRSQWRMWWQHIWKPLTTLAVPALLLLLWFQWPEGVEQPVSATFAAVSSQEIEQYIEEHLEAFTVMDLVAMAEIEVLDKWQEGIVQPIAPTRVTPSSPVETPSINSNQSFEKALETTQSDDLLDELTTDDLSLEEDWF
ncbi:MAG: hypothetical protein ACRBFS_04775 [Aureispira sp.]